MANLYSSFKKLFSIEKKTSIKSIHGLRGIAILTTIFIHSYWHRLMSSFLSQEEKDEFENTNFAVFLMMCTMVVDIFFVISATLASKSILKDFEGYENI